MTNYYEILEAKESATPAEIKDAYRVMAMKWHPVRSLIESPALGWAWLRIFRFLL